MVKKEIGNQRLNCGMWLYPFCFEIRYTLYVECKYVYLYIHIKQDLNEVTIVSNITSRIDLYPVCHD